MYLNSDDKKGKMNFFLKNCKAKKKKKQQKYIYLIKLIIISNRVENIKEKGCR